MSTLDIARQLGVEIQKDERYKKYLAAKLKNDNDPELQAAIGEFNIARMALDNEIQKGENKDEKKVAEINDQLRAAYTKVMSNQSMAEYNNAKVYVDELVNEIEAIISAAISGEDPMTVDVHANCTHDCSTCGGCH